MPMLQKKIWKYKSHYEIYHLRRVLTRINIIDCLNMKFDGYRIKS
jgi:hypothetical protein